MTTGVPPVRETTAESRPAAQQRCISGLGTGITTQLTDISRTTGQDSQIRRCKRGQGKTGPGRAGQDRMARTEQDRTGQGRT